MSEMEFTNYIEVRMEWEIAKTGGSDPLLFSSTNFKFMEAEWQMHKGLTKFVYGPDALNPRPKEVGGEEI